MKSIYRYILLIFFLEIPLIGFAIDTSTLRDTLTYYANQQAAVGRICNIKVTKKKNIIKITTNKALSGLDFTPELVNLLYKKAAEILYPNEKVKIEIYSNDHEISELIPARFRPHPTSKTHTLSSSTPIISNVSCPYHPTKGLENIHLALWASHGLFYSGNQDRWHWQRARVHTTVEDLFTSSFTIPFLVPMLENAGAIVFQPRERDIQVKEIILDDSNIELPGEWETADDEGFANPNGMIIGEANPFRMGSYAISKPINKKDKEARLRYTPSIKEDLTAALYVSYKSLGNSTSRAEYTVVHKGISTTYLINQNMGGGTWIYLGTFTFGTQVQENYIEVSNFAQDGGVVTSDAIRIGGGKGSVGRYPKSDTLGLSAHTSGYPRWQEASRYWLQYAGIPASVYSWYNGEDDYKDDYTCRGHWVNYLAGGSAAFPDGKGLHIPIHASFAFHTDAGKEKFDSIVGTLMIYTSEDDEKLSTFPTHASRAINRDYASYVQEQIAKDIAGVDSIAWTKRDIRDASYRETRIPKVPAVILELLSHQNFRDMQFGLDPRNQFIISRAVYKGILRFLHEQYATPFVVQPLPVKGMHIDLLDGDSMQLRWKAREDKLEPSANATYFVVYTRVDNGDWDNGRIVKDSNYEMKMERGKNYDLMVRAGNEGGVSMESEILSAGLATNERGRVLIVNGFTQVSAPESFIGDSTHAGFLPYSFGTPYKQGIAYIGTPYSFDITDPWISDDMPGYGATHNNYARTYVHGNTFDFPSMHARVLQQMEYSYASSSASSIEQIGNFDIVDLIMGKQQTQYQRQEVDSFMPTALRLAIADYMLGNGRILVSGSQIGQEMNKKTKGIDWAKFAETSLNYSYQACHASCVGEVGTSKDLGALTLHAQMYPNEKRLVVDNVDGLKPCHNGKVVGRYTDSSTSAAIAWEEGEKRTLVFGFPLESTLEFDEIYTNCINWLDR